MEPSSNFFSSLLLVILERYVDIHLSPSTTRIWQAFVFLLMEGGSQVHFFLIHGMLTPFMLISTKALPHSEHWIHM